MNAFNISLRKKTVSLKVALEGEEKNELTNQSEVLVSAPPCWLFNKLCIVLGTKNKCNYKHVEVKWSLMNNTWHSVRLTCDQLGIGVN